MSALVSSMVMAVSPVVSGPVSVVSTLGDAREAGIGRIMQRRRPVDGQSCPCDDVDMRLGSSTMGRQLSRRLDWMVERTPDDRERYIDFLRLFSIGVVIIWHWSLSVNYWTGDRFVNPNPIESVPGGWALTWLLQIMPVFFIVGGYANYAAWESARRRGQGWPQFLGRRLQRLLVPVAVFAVLWTLFEVVAHLVVPGYLGIMQYAWLVFTPLWFIGAYTGVVLLSPLTAALHQRSRWITISVLAGAVLIADVGRLAGGVGAFGVINTGLVWVLIHQLGYFYRDGTLLRFGRTGALVLAGGGGAALVGMTVLGPYPRSMVAVPEQQFSNILPTSAAIAVVAIFQLGVIMLARNRVSRWLRRPVAWKPVVAGNAVILTIFVWHMTALLIVLVSYRAAGGVLLAVPTAEWWSQRWFWLTAPALVLAVFVAAFGRLEVNGLRGWRGRARRRTR
jgi:Acyltransferase family